METELRPTKCLVVAPNWVGDTIMALPVLDVLVHSGRRVFVLAKPHLHPLLRQLPGISGLVESSSSRGETIGRLRHEQFEEAVLLPNSFRAAWLAWRAGIPSRWGYRSDGRSLLLGPAVHLPSRSGHQLHDYDRLLKAMGLPPISGVPRLELSEEVRARGAAALGEAGVDVEERPRLAGLFPGAEFGPSKRWAVDRFARTAVALGELAAEVHPIVISGPSERELADSVGRIANLPLPIVGSDLDLAELASVLARLDVLITNDSGPMHLAAAVGTPCIAIFGPTDPRRTSPSGGGHHVLSVGRWCAPCFRRRCPLIRHRCMKEIGVGHVVAATRKVLA